VEIRWSEQTGVKVRVKVKDGAAKAGTAGMTLTIARDLGSLLNGSAIRLDAGLRFAPK
jgi:hypothetical protein